MAPTCWPGAAFLKVQTIARMKGGKPDQDILGHLDDNADLHRPFAHQGAGGDDGAARIQGAPSQAPPTMWSIFVALMIQGMMTIMGTAQTRTIEVT